MPSDLRSKSTGAAVLGRALEVKPGARGIEGAKFILDLDIRSEDKARASDLLRRRQEGKLSPEEDEELAAYIQADDVLSILRAKALAVLKRAGADLGEPACSPRDESFDLQRCFDRRARS